MKKTLIITLSLLSLIGACSVSSESTSTPEPEILYEQVVDKGKIYSSKDFFDAGFKEYKEYNVSKLTGATEAWYGYWGQNEDNVKYYELRFYPDHSTAVLDGTPFAEDATGEDAKLRRQETMWRVGLAERKIDASCKRDSSKGPTQTSPNCGNRVWKYADYMIFNNVIILCEGEDSEEAFKRCNELIKLVSK